MASIRTELRIRPGGTLTGLPSGTRQYVLLRAIGLAGPGPWSESADNMVP